MELSVAINSRHSIRGFLPKPVDQQVLRKVLQLGIRAVSARNIQPWEFIVVTGDILKSICQDNMECLAQGLPGRREYGILDGVYRERSVVVAKQLLSSMKIDRKDVQERAQWMKRGYRFFDAPVALILCMDASLDEKVYRFDMGCVAQTICFAALEYGLATCIEEQGVYYESGLRKYLQIPDNKRIVIAIAIGYPDPEFPANHVITPRDNVETLTQWHGFV